MLLGKITRISLQLTLAAVMICAVGCSGGKDGVVLRTEALDASSWDASVWISAADAAVVEGTITGETRAADGASWFVSTVRNEKDVTSAKWMTTGLGVYEMENRCENGEGTFHIRTGEGRKLPVHVPKLWLYLVL